MSSSSQPWCTFLCGANPPPSGGGQTLARARFIYPSLRIQSTTHRLAGGLHGPGGKLKLRAPAWSTLPLPEILPRRSGPKGREKKGRRCAGSWDRGARLDTGADSGLCQCDPGGLVGQLPGERSGWASALSGGHENAKDHFLDTTDTARLPASDSDVRHLRKRDSRAGWPSGSSRPFVAPGPGSLGSMGNRCRWWQHGGFSVAGRLSSTNCATDRHAHAALESRLDHKALDG